MIIESVSKKDFIVVRLYSFKRVLIYQGLLVNNLWLGIELNIYKNQIFRVIKKHSKVLKVINI